VNKVTMAYICALFDLSNFYVKELNPVVSSLKVQALYSCWHSGKKIFCFIQHRTNIDNKNSTIYSLKFKYIYENTSFH